MNKPNLPTEIAAALGVGRRTDHRARILLRRSGCRGGETQQTQLAMLLVLRRKGGGTLPRDFIRFSRCLFRRILNLNRSGFEGVFAQGRGVERWPWSIVISNIVRVRHRFTKSHERY